MPHTTRIAAVILLAISPAAPILAGVLTQKPCIRGVEAAATLLVPYFEVDLDDPGGLTTLFAVTNAKASPGLAHVTVWSDWAIPVLTFDLYLTGYDVVTINLRDVLGGFLPATGQQSSNRGGFSHPNAPFPNCDPDDASGGAFDPAFLRAALTGQSVGGSCYASPRADATRATGYLTIDAVRECTALAPGDAGYFADGAGIALDENRWWGDVFYVEPADAFAQGDAAVHVVADPDAFGPGDYTFYGRYHGFDGSDNRAPLSGLHYTRFLQGGVFSGGTELVVWRDTRSAGRDPVACGSSPSWAPLGELEIRAFDEEENGLFIGGLGSASALPWATQKARPGEGELGGVPFPFGWLWLDLFHGDGSRAQAWVTTILRAEGVYSIGMPVARLDDLCEAGL